ncbi:S41 family peptidase [Mycoplasmopsis agalactiae]|uniref:S41 family peptidase n=1 Tax=Mycoplasmopsis agalactiae TaxID=2110 RepID=UPI001F95893F|nr:S41 family peptidase [Mycoplasmopsis agalactiae]MCE6115130.1 peptidase S41 [Mycoplasmopsis agalactiae]
MRRNNWSKKSKIKLLKFVVPTFSFLPIAISASCDNSSFSRHSITNKVADDLRFDKSYSFTNLSDEYKNKDQQIKAYRHKDTEDLYINVNEFLTKLSGIFNTSELKINKVSDGVFEWSRGSNKAIYDTKSNVIKMNTTGAFFLVRGSSTTDYSRNIKELKQKVTRLDNEEFSTLDLEKYGMSIKEIDGNIFMPFSLFNLLYGSQSYYNIYFNNDKFIGTTVTVNKDSDPKEYNKIMTNSRNNTKQTVKERINTYNFLRFLFDNFYGIKEKFLEKKNAKDFDEYFSKTVIKDTGIIDPNEAKMTLKERMLSTDALVNGRAYTDFYYKELNELHSSIESGSYFHPADYRAEPFGQALSGRVNEFVYYLNTLSKLRLGILEGDKNKFVNFHNDIAIIYLDNFNVASDEDINKPDAHTKDSYILMSKAMKMIKEHSEKNTPIKRIILDLSINGGGAIVAMKKVAGFLSSKDQQLYTYEKINKILDYSRFRVDINNDKKYDEKDNTNEYKWYILAGVDTFSAANLLTHIAKENKFATIIGNKSGGGMWSILPLVIPDGTSFKFSSNNAWVSWVDKKIEKPEDLPYTQDGIDPDIEIPYFAYYNYDIIEAYLESKEKGDDKYHKYERGIKTNAWKRVADNIEVLLNAIQDEYKKEQFSKTFEENKLKDSDSIDEMQKKIEKIEELFRFVEFQYKLENPGLR